MARENQKRQISIELTLKEMLDLYTGKIPRKVKSSLKKEITEAIKVNGSTIETIRKSEKNPALKRFLRKVEKEMLEEKARNLDLEFIERYTLDEKNPLNLRWFLIEKSVNSLIERFDKIYLLKWNIEALSKLTSIIKKTEIKKKQGESKIKSMRYSIKRKAEKRVEEIDNEKWKRIYENFVESNLSKLNKAS